jgi:hypothetical protein
VFTGLVENTGANAAARLKQIASETHLAAMTGGGDIVNGTMMGTSPPSTIDDEGRPPLCKDAPPVLELSPRSTDSQSPGSPGDAARPALDSGSDEQHLNVYQNEVAFKSVRSQFEEDLAVHAPGLVLSQLTHAEGVRYAEGIEQPQQSADVVWNERHTDVDN